ncbi:hypothetical protein LEMLEM_LOCUS26260, partial [Lemmus lemmus]
MFPSNTACLSLADRIHLEWTQGAVSDDHEQVQDWSLQSFASFISTPDFIKDEGHQPHSYPNFLVNLGIVGFHGVPDILNEALKHLSGTKATPDFHKSGKGPSL